MHRYAKARECMMKTKEGTMDGNETDMLRARIKQLEYENGTTYCAYCGERFSDAASVGLHIRACPKHPMRALEATIAELKERLALAEGKDKCESCGRIIEPGEPRHDWHDGVTTCMKCGIHAV